MKNRLFLAAIVAVIGSFIAVSANAEPSQFAFFDLMKFVNKSVKAKEQQEKLKKIAELKASNLENKRKELATLQEQLQKQAPMLKEETRNEKIKEIGSKEFDYKMAEKEAQTTVQNEERAFMEILQRDVTKIVSKIRTDRKLLIVFGSQMLISADDNLDITDEVIKLYDADADAGKASAAPKQGPAAGPAKPKAPAGK